MSRSSVDEIEFRDGFSFGDEVASVFPDMIRRSIPDYAGMRRTTRLVGGRFANSPWHTVADVGSSLGDAFRPYAEAGCRVVSIDPSEPMLRRQNKAYEGFDNISYLKSTAIAGLGSLDDESLDLCIFCLTLQFINRCDRPESLEVAYRKLKSGGGLIVVQKDKTNNKFVDDLIIEKYYKLKYENGYTIDQIESKKRALNGYMDIDSYKESADLIIGAGFKSVNEYWRALNFSAVLAVK